MAGYKTMWEEERKTYDIEKAGAVFGNIMLRMV
ncbi:hypothetical protein [Tenacibaculum maritimum]